MIWEQTVDGGAFHCWVAPTDNEYRGVLHVRRVTTNEVILKQEVSVSYAARFGPDVDDVRYWQQMSLQVIDALIAQEASNG